MSARERVTRPVPERTEPMRSWSSLFTAPEAAPADGGRPAGGDDMVSRAVSLGYRVVDEYIRQGERAARALGGGPNGPAGGDVQDLTARMAQYAQDFLGLWMQLVELATAGSSLRRPVAQAEGNGGVLPAAGAPAPSPSEPVRASIEVASARPIEVSLDLRPEAAGVPLVVHDLRAAAPDLPRLTGVVLEPGDPPRLRLRVPDDQPAGVYHGVVVDERTSRALGTVSVRVAP